MQKQGREVATAKAPKLRRASALGGRPERKLGALAGKITIAVDFDQTPVEVIEAFEGK